MTEPSGRFHPDNTIPTNDWIFVFGSNRAGRHGKGAAKVARTNLRAEYGVGIGLTGRAYAIPTKDEHLNVLPLQDVKYSVQAFLRYAVEHPQQRFFVTAIGTGQARFADREIAPLFADAPANCSLPEQWRELIYSQQQPDPRAAAQVTHPRQRA
jgi:hypothetical protein